MKYRIAGASVNAWEADLTVVEADPPNKVLHFFVPTHEPLTEEALAVFVRKAVEKDRNAVANLELVFEAHRSGRVLEA